MYTKLITFEKFLPLSGTWIYQKLKTTNDAIWIHLEQLNLRKDVRKIVVKDIVV